MAGSQKKTYLIIVALLAWLTVGCENQKYSQCQELIAIANGANNQAQKITRNSSQKLDEMKTWLQASNIMKIAAQEIEAVPIKDPQLIGYQANLASVFQVYSQAIYDAVKAREKKNLSALEVAHDNAQKVWQLNQTLVTEINQYCLAQ